MRMLCNLALRITSPLRHWQMALLPRLYFTDNTIRGVWGNFSLSVQQRIALLSTRICTNRLGLPECRCSNNQLKQDIQLRPTKRAAAPVFIGTKVHLRMRGMSFIFKITYLLTYLLSTHLLKRKTPQRKCYAHTTLS